MKQRILPLLLALLLLTGCGGTAPTEAPDQPSKYQATYYTLFDTMTIIQGYALSEEYVRELGFAVEPPMVEIPSRRSIHTVFNNSGGRGSFSPSLLQYALDYAAERGVSVFGPVYGVLLASIEEEEGLTGYFEAWLPIE